MSEFSCCNLSSESQKPEILESKPVNKENLAKIIKIIKSVGDEFLKTRGVKSCLISVSLTSRMIGPQNASSRESVLRFTVNSKYREEAEVYRAGIDPEAVGYLAEIRYFRYFKTSKRLKSKYTDEVF